MTLTANSTDIKSDDNKGEDLPFVSLIMPIRNEEAFIERSLGAVLDQDYPHDKMEVLIADGMSTDGTRDKISRMATNRTPPVTVLDNPDMIVPSAMNIAIRRAKGEIIVRVDGHAVIQPDYVRKCVTCLIKTGVDCVGGAVDSVGSGYVGEAIALAMSSRFGIGGSVFRTWSGNGRPMPAETVPFGAYRKDVFERIGLFNERMVRHQDYEFCFRLRKNGGRILILPSARAVYFVRSTLGSLWKQYWQYGIWKGRLVRVHPESCQPRHLIPPVFVFVLAGSGLSSVFSTLGAWAFSLTIGAYLAFVLTAVAALSTRGNGKYAPVLSIIFPCLHLSWGLGFWKGLCSLKQRLYEFREVEKTP